MVQGVPCNLIGKQIRYTKYSQLVDMVKALVEAAEKLYNGSGRGSEKLVYVMNQATEYAKKIGIEIDPEDLRAIVESFVYGLTNTESDKSDKSDMESDKETESEA